VRLSPGQVTTQTLKVAEALLPQAVLKVPKF